MWFHSPVLQSLSAVTADVPLVAVVAVLGQVHDPVVVVVALGPVHDDLLRGPPVPHNNALWKNLHDKKIYMTSASFEIQLSMN